MRTSLAIVVFLTLTIRAAADDASVYATAKVALAKGQIVKSRLLGFSLQKYTFSEAPKMGAVLIGLEVGLNGNNVVAGVRPIYRTEEGDTWTADYGLFEDGYNEDGNKVKSRVLRVEKIRARAGYAVGALTMKSGLGVDGLSLTFMRVVGNALDPATAYSSPWVGGMGGGGKQTAGGNGTPVIGIYGCHDGVEVRALGLIHVSRKAMVAKAPEPEPSEIEKTELPALPAVKPAPPVAVVPKSAPPPKQEEAKKKAEEPAPEAKELVKSPAPTKEAKKDRPPPESPGWIPFAVLVGSVLAGVAGVAAIGIAKGRSPAGDPVRRKQAEPDRPRRYLRKNR